MVESTTIQMEIQESWLRNMVMYFPKECADFFPKDSFGARGKTEKSDVPPMGKPVALDFGVGIVECDIVSDNGGKRMRPRERKCIRLFYEGTKAKSGDFIVVTRSAPRTFKIRLVRA